MADETWIMWKNVHRYFAGHIMRGKDLIRRAISNGEHLILLLTTRPSSFYSKCFWLTCLLGYSRFPYQEDRINTWFSVQGFQPEGGQGHRVNVMNVDREGIRTNIYRTQYQASNFPNSLSDRQFDVFFHGTNHRSAQNIIEKGIDLSKARKELLQDFSAGDAYYLSASFDVAFDWATRHFHPNEGQAVIIYRVDNRQLRGDNNDNGLDLRNDESEWLRVVTEYRKPSSSHGSRRRRPEPADKKLRKRLSQLHFIEGPITSGSQSRPSSMDFHNGSYQLCVRNDICAQLFNNSLHSVVFLRG